MKNKKLENIKEGIKELDELREYYELRMCSKRDVQNGHECFEAAAWLYQYVKYWDTVEISGFQKSLKRAIRLSKKYRKIQNILKKVYYNAYTNSEDGEDK